MNKLKYNYLNIPTIETQRLILNSPLEKDYEAIQYFLKSDRSKFIGGPYSNFTSWSDYNGKHRTLVIVWIWTMVSKN